jgi:hypothetical protein
MIVPDITPTLDQIRTEAATEAARVISRFWFIEAAKISAATPDAEARWDLLLTALRRIGWPES